MKHSLVPVAIIMGSDSDFEVMQEASQALQDFGISFHLEVVSAHRTPEKMFTFAKTAKANGYQVLIAGAGGAAHLPGMVASLTTLPVIGVPVESKSLKGMDSLLSIAQMPKGVPVATMAINGAYNAGLMAIKILASSQIENKRQSNPNISPNKNNKSTNKILTIAELDLEKKLENFMDQQKSKVENMNKKMNNKKNAKFSKTNKK